MTDQWGIPERILGPIDNGFAGAIGRVAMLSAVLEERLLYLLWAVTSEYQYVAAGTFGSDLTKEIRREVKVLPDALVDRISVFTDRADRCREARNQTLHSCYPDATLVQAFQWRSLPRNQRGRPEDFTATAEITRSDLQAQITELINLIDESGPLTSQASFEFEQIRSSRLAPGTCVEEGSGA